MRILSLTFCVATAGLLVGSLAVPTVVFGQDLKFEQVGDRALDASDLDFGEDGVLWASSPELWKLDPATQVWEEITTLVNDYVLILSADTVIIGQRFGVLRSADRGQTWIVVHEMGGGALFEADVAGLNSGLVLSANDAGIAYSTDRGASFTSSTFTVSTSRESTLHSAVEIPDGPAAGRLVAGVFNGIVVSEDGGRTWAPSSLFEGGLRFSTERVVIGEAPSTGARRLYATVIDSQASDPQLYISDDDGLTWTNVPGMVDAYLFVNVPGGGGSLLAVEKADGFPEDRLEVWRSPDSGQSWLSAGQLPAEPDDDLISTNDMLIGPDGHLYIAVGRSGPEPEWVYRSNWPVVVASEPAPQLPEPGEALRVYPNPAADRLTIEGAAGAEAVLFDVLGRAVLRQRLVGGRAVLDTSRLPAGVYVVRVGSNSRLITIHH